MKKGLYLIFDIKSICFAFSAFFILLLVSVAVAAQKTVAVLGVIENKNPIVIIDAGHGGEDGGTQAADGTLEKDINLAISLKLNKILTRYGFQTIMVREKDHLIYDDNLTTMRSKKASDLHNRMALMKNHPDAIFLSIHQNHFSQNKYSGAQVFYGKNNESSAKLAECIQKSIVGNLQKENTRQIKPSTSSVYLIYNAVTTAVMVECGFLSNEQEANRLKDNTYQYEMALAIAKGLVNFLEFEGS